MKKIISLFLCMIMLLSTISLFSSCAKSNGDPKVSKKMVDVNVSEYTVVYGNELSTNTKTQASDFVTKLTALTGAKVKAKNDSETTSVSTEDKEILIGKTCRTETDKVVKSLGDCGWAIRVFDNKIVIVGTNSFMTRAALDYFVQNYLTKDNINGTKVSVNQKISLAKVNTIELLGEVEDGNGQPYTSGLFNIVYSDTVDDVNQQKDYGQDRDPKGGVNTDYTYDYCTELSKLLVKTTQMNKGAFPLKSDADEEGELEFLVGKVNREDYMTELRKLEANQYGVTIKNGKIMVLAWNDTMLKTAYTMLEDLVASSVVDDGKGNFSYLVPATCSLIETSGGAYHVDFPKPEGQGITLDSIVDAGDNSMEYIYTGTGVNRSSFVAYCNKLEAEGYAMVGKENQAYGNSFRQYLNNTTGSTLYVYHSPYNYAEAQGVTDVLPSLRVIAATTESVHLPDSAMLSSNQSYEPITDTMISSLRFNYTDVKEVNGKKETQFGMTYIYTLADGSFIIFDGGSLAGGAPLDYNYIYENLYNLYKMTHKGQDPTPGSIRVRAWIITHEHGDHFGVFQQFMKKKVAEKNSTVKVDYLLFNAVAEVEGYNTTNPASTIQNYIPDMEKNCGTKYIKVHTGQVFYFANAKVEILYTHEDAYPSKLEFFNNSSTVCKITTTGEGGSTSAIWTGDVERIGSRRLRAMWGGEMLKADMVQVAHHGVNGAEAAFYDLVKPTVVWFPASAHTVKTRSDSKTDDYWPNEVDYHVCREIETVKLIVAADHYETTIVLKNGLIPSDYAVHNLGDADFDPSVGFNENTLITPDSSLDNQSSVIKK